MIRAVSSIFGAVILPFIAPRYESFICVLRSRSISFFALAVLFGVAIPILCPAQSNVKLPGRFPQASERLLTEADVRGVTEADLKLMRNEILARHGQIFRSDDLRTYFESQRWYQPITQSVNAALTDIEQKNIILIKSAEQGALLTDDDVVVSAEGIRLPRKLKSGLKRMRLPGKVNTKAHESNAIVSADGSIMVLTYEEQGSTAGQDIYISERDNAGEWEVAQSVGAPLNNFEHNYAVSLSADNNTMVVGNRYNERGRVTGPGLSITRRASSGWSIPTPVDFTEYVNQGAYVAACIAPTGETMILAIQGAESRGSHDLYVAHRVNDRLWSAPINLGDVLNTSGEETTPFLAADGKTLFFSSNGHKGHGKLDVFMSRRLDESWMQWSTPVNLGPEINNADNQAFYTVTADGTYAYFTEPGPDGSRDIWRVELPESMIPLPTVVISGVVYDNSNRRPVSATVSYERLSDGKRLGSGHTDPASGAFTIVLAAGQVDGDVFSMRAEAEGYFPISDTVETTALAQGGEIRRDLYLEPARSGRTIRLNNVFFDVGKWEVLPESNADLDRFVAMVESRPSLVIMIGGHTDDVGDDIANQDLSQRRAQAVRAYAIEKGVDSTRITAVGFGESRPIVPNTTPENRQQNRRVEFTIVRDQ